MTDSPSTNQAAPTLDDLLVAALQGISRELERRDVPHVLMLADEPNPFKDEDPDEPATIKRRTLNIKGIPVLGKESWKQTIAVQPRCTKGSGRFGRIGGGRFLGYDLKIDNGRYGNEHIWARYPQNKLGSFNYAAVVDKLLDIVEERQSKINAEQKRKDNVAAVQRVCAEVGLTSTDIHGGFGGVAGSLRLETSIFDAGPVHVNFVLKRNLSEAEAIRVLKGLVALGLIVNPEPRN